MKRFERFAKTVAANAATYKSAATCRTQLTKLNNLYLAAGSYGCQADLRRKAIAAIQDRFVLGF